MYAVRVRVHKACYVNVQCIGANEYSVTEITSTSESKDPHPIYLCFFVLKFHVYLVQSKGRLCAF